MSRLILIIGLCAALPIIDVYAQQEKYSNPRLVRAIEKASYYACMKGEDKRGFLKKEIILVVQYCRATWDNQGDFMEYVKAELERSYANCDGWYKYFKVFYK